MYVCCSSSAGNISAVFGWESRESFRLAWERIEFDETKQRLQVKSHRHLFACQQVSSWSVFVCCHEFGWIAGDGPDEQVHVLDLLRLNSILVGSCSSVAIWDVLEGRELMEVRRALDAIREKADNYFVEWEPDAASPNLRLGFDFMEVLRTSASQAARLTLFSLLPCGLHQLSHVVQAVCASRASLTLIRGLYSCALLLDAGTYFMIMVCIHTQITRRLVVVVHEPPGDAYF